ncbi:MAG TPA: SpoIIE family protein phosphatase [Gemmataceae bacterium]|jgi:serine phosphatase RsbU (regulator of sigma subunit)/pSer/pThr/pTyr-binding forkhead associated (FHA) protein|nr:SpoIIE family protein phosphatase [Gemmataceae bacterium]
MPSLHILKGANEGTLIPLDGDRFILGRNPDCGIVIPITSVSREHAQILRVQGLFYIEDKQSRNGTFVNNQAITARTPLKNNDKIRICDFLAAFLDNPEAAEEEEEVEASSTVEAMLSHSSHQLLDTQPAEKLRHLLEISANLSKTLELDALLPKIVDSLFQMFRQADRCFLIQTEEGSGKLMSRVVKTRRAHDEPNARFSRSIVRRCLDTSQAFLSDDASRDDRIQLSQSVVDFRIRSVMCVPVCAADGKAFGVIQLDTQDRSKKFTQEDLKLLWGVANQAAVALENTRLHLALLEEAVVQERMKRDLELASRIQRSFLPQSLPQVPGYEFAAHYESAMEVGGDYYGFIPLPQGRLAVALGDVAGKGVPAALLMAKLSSDARFSLLTEPDAGRAVGKLNDLLYEFTSEADRFVTLAVAVLDPARHSATLVNAGHLTPLVYRQATGLFHEAVPKDKAGVPLGILEGFRFESCQVALGPGDTLLMFTDGVTDASGVQNTAFGTKGMEAVLAAVAPAAPGAVVESLTKAVKQHAAGRPPIDDVTLVALGRTP